MIWANVDGSAPLQMLWCQECQKGLSGRFELELLGIVQSVVNWIQ